MFFSRISSSSRLKSIVTTISINLLTWLLLTVQVYVVWEFLCVYEQMISCNLFLDNYNWKDLVYPNCPEMFLPFQLHHPYLEGNHILQSISVQLLIVLPLPLTVLAFCWFFLLWCYFDGLFVFVEFCKVHQFTLNNNKFWFFLIIYKG